MDAKRHLARIARALRYAPEHMSGGSTLSELQAAADPAVVSRRLLPSRTPQPWATVQLSRAASKADILPVADLSCLDKVVQCQLVADTAISVVDDYVKQLSSFWLRRGAGLRCPCLYLTVPRRYRLIQIA